MKKYRAIILAVIMTLAGLSACGNYASGNSSGASLDGAVQEKPLQIVTTIFPEYDWVREILGDCAGQAEITMLFRKGVDLHSYQPSVEDIIKISACDLFIYVGGESDEWVKGVLQEAVNKEMKVISLLEVLGGSAMEEEPAEGMEGRAHEHGHRHEEVLVYDEHVWLSLKNAEVFCNVISDALAEIDPDHAEVYKNHAAVYNEKLHALDVKYQSAAGAAGQKTLLFGDRFPFGYLAKDYDISCYAAFMGCSAETGASFETITFLAGKVDELGLHHVLTLEKSDQRIAQTIVQNTKSKGQQILALDSMQSTTFGEASGGATYLSVMESNLAVLKEALR